MNGLYTYSSVINPNSYQPHPNSFQPAFFGYDYTSNKNWVYMYLDKMYSSVIPDAFYQKNSPFHYFGEIKSYNPVWNHEFYCKSLPINFKVVLRGFFKFYILLLEKINKKRNNA